MEIFHAEDGVGPFNEFPRYLLADMPLNIDPIRRHDLDRFRGRPKPDHGTDAGRQNLEVVASFLLQDIPKQSLGHHRPTAVAGANEKNFFG